MTVFVVKCEDQTMVLSVWLQTRNQNHNDRSEPKRFGVLVSLNIRLFFELRSCKTDRHAMLVCSNPE